MSDHPHQDATYYAMGRRKRRRWPWVTAACLWLLVGAGAGAVFSGILKADKTRQETLDTGPAAVAAQQALDPEVPDQPINILLIGSDKRTGREAAQTGLSDSIILVKLDFKRDFISMLSFQRDLWVHIPGHGMSKINAAYQLGGTKLVKETVKELTGQPINQYVNIDFQGFRNLVKAVGGVYVDVDRRYYHRNLPGACPGGRNCYSELDIQPGYQRLNGVDALAFARYRHDDSDNNRVIRQQLFLSELKRQVKDNVLDTPSFIHALADKKGLTHSFKSTRKFLDIVQFAIGIEKSRISRGYVSGTSGSVGAAAVQLQVPGEIAQKVAEWQRPAFIVGPPERRVSPATVTVAVLNGGGRLLGGEDVAQALRGQGYQAYVAGNTPRSNYRDASVFFASNREDAGRQIRDLLGAQASIAPRSRDQVNPLTKQADVIVIAGASFHGLTLPKRANAKGAKRRADTVSTTALVPLLRAAKARSGLAVLAPTKVAREARVRTVREYLVDGKRPALKIVFESGYRKYWAIEEMKWKNPPILKGRTAGIRKCHTDLSTFYDGKNMMRLAWQRGDTTYWVSNSLDYALTSETMYDIACNMRPVNRASLPKGVVNTKLSIRTSGDTP